MWDLLPSYTFLPSGTHQTVCFFSLPGVLSGQFVVGTLVDVTYDFVLEFE